MVRTISSAFTVPEIRKKLAFTAGMLALYRLGSHIPVPGVNLSAVNNIQKEFDAQNPGSSLKQLGVGGTDIDEMNKAALLFRSPSTTPDVIQLPTTYTSQFASSGYLLPLTYLLGSLFWGPPAGPSPWRATGLEGQTPSPPPPHNFDSTPTVTRGPYEYTLFEETVIVG